MISLYHWLGTQFTSQLAGPAGVLLVICLQVALLASLSQLLSLSIKQAAIRHRLWLTSVLLVLALLPLHVFFGGWPVVIASQAQSVPAMVQPQPTVPLLNTAPSISPDDTIEPIDAHTNPVSDDATALNPPNDTSTPSTTPPKINLQQWAVTGLLIAYLSIASCLAWRTALATSRLVRHARTAQPPSDPLIQLMQRLAVELGLKRLPKIGMSEHTSMPLVFGFFKTTILLPINFVAWNADGQRAVLAHELAHVARRDAWGQLLSRAMCCVYWFHPASWWIERRLSETRELATDQRALSTGLSAQEYAFALVNVLKQLHSSNTPGLALPIAAATPMRKRISYLLTSTAQDSARGRWLGIALTTVLVAIAGLSCVRLVTSTLANNPLLTGPLPTEPLPQAAAQPTAQRRPEDNDLFVRMCECDLSKVSAEKAGAKVTISGRILSKGQAVAGATVVFRESSTIYLSSDRDMDKYGGGRDGSWSPTPDVLARTLTKADGCFEFKSITVTKRDRPDKWRGDVVAIHPVSGFAWMVFHIQENVDLVKENVSLDMQELTDISGVVLNPLQEPVAGTEVLIDRFQVGPQPLPNPISVMFETNHSQLTVSTRTDGNGKFTLKNLPRNMIAQVIASHSDYLFSVGSVATFDPAQLPPEAISRGFSANVQTSPCSIVMNKGVIITGQVVDKISRQPVSDVRVRQERWDGNWKTDQAGKFRLHLPPLKAKQSTGSSHEERVAAQLIMNTLEIVPPKESGYLEQHYKLDPNAPERPLELGLERGVWIRGKVVADNGQPMKKVIVRVWDAKDYEVIHQTATNDQGAYELLAPAKAELRIVVGGHEHGYQMPLWREFYAGAQMDTTDWPSLVLNTSNGKTQSPPNIVVPRVPPIECLVSFADGKPATGVSVVIKDNRDPSPFGWGGLAEISDIAQTNQQGRASLRSRKPTEKAVVLTKVRIGDQTYENEFNLKKSQDPNGLVKIVVVPPVQLTGRVLRNGQPVFGAIVRIGGRDKVPGHGQEIETATNEDGIFQASVPPNDYVVYLVSLPNHHGNWGGHKAVQRVNGALQAGDLEINLPLEELAGQLVDQGGKPIADARILAVPLNANAPFFPDSSVVSSDKNGNFKFPKLMQGEYDLKIKLRNGAVIESINQRLRPGRNVSTRVSITIK